MEENTKEEVPVRKEERPVLDSRFEYRDFPPELSSIIDDYREQHPDFFRPARVGELSININYGNSILPQVKHLLLEGYGDRLIKTPREDLYELFDSYVSGAKTFIETLVESGEVLYLTAGDPYYGLLKTPVNSGKDFQSIPCPVFEAMIMEESRRPGGHYTQRGQLGIEKQSNENWLRWYKGTFEKSGIVFGTMSRYKHEEDIRRAREEELRSQIELQYGKREDGLWRYTYNLPPSDDIIPDKDYTQLEQLGYNTVEINKMIRKLNSQVISTIQRLLDSDKNAKVQWEELVRVIESLKLLPYDMPDLSKINSAYFILMGQDNLDDPYRLYLVPGGPEGIEAVARYAIGYLADPNPNVYVPDFSILPREVVEKILEKKLYNKRVPNLDYMSLIRNAFKLRMYDHPIIYITSPFSGLNE